MEKNTWPEFVTDGETETRRQVVRAALLTGWETVVFELDDADLQEWETAFSSHQKTGFS